MAKDNLLRILENGNEMYQVCGSICYSGRPDQRKRICPLNIFENESGTIGDALSVILCDTCAKCIA